MLLVASSNGLCLKVVSTLVEISEGILTPTLAASCPIETDDNSLVVSPSLFDRKLLIGFLFPIISKVLG